MMQGLIITPAQCVSALPNMSLRTTKQTVLRGARAEAAAAGSPSFPILNAETIEAMLPAMMLTLGSLGAIKVRVVYLLL